jgi:hypothetical protein
MAKKADIINSFIQAKKSKKNRKLTKVQTVNRLLGSQVLHTNQIIKISKLKNVQGDTLSRRTVNHGFIKTITEMRDNLPRPERQASKIVHNRGFEIIAFMVNDLLLNPTAIARGMMFFFILNIIYYSLCTVYNYYYNPLIVIILLISSFIVGFISLIMAKPKKQ